MRNIMLKEIKLSASPLAFLFIAFGLMFFIPGYPILCGAVSSQVKYRNFRQKMQSFSASIFSCNRPVVC